jgi:hypothetical protein
MACTTLAPVTVRLTARGAGLAAFGAAQAVGLDGRVVGAERSSQMVHPA